MDSSPSPKATHSGGGECSSPSSAATSTAVCCWFCRPAWHWLGPTRPPPHLPGDAASTRRTLRWLRQPLPLTAHLGQRPADGVVLPAGGSRNPPRDDAWRTRLTSPGRRPRDCRPGRHGRPCADLHRLQLRQPGGAAWLGGPRCNRHRLRPCRTQPAGRTGPRVAEGLSDGACHHGRYRGDHCNRPVLHGEPGLAGARRCCTGAGRAGRLVACRSSLPRHLYRRRRTALGGNLSLRHSRHLGRR